MPASLRPPKQLDGLGHLVVYLFDLVRLPHAYVGFAAPIVYH